MSVVNNSSDQKNTLVVNLFGAPGCGKSTTAASVFAKLKMAGIDCELVTEFAKDLVWEKRPFTLDDQLYVFAKQHHRLWRLNGQVDVIITDSPILLSIYYDTLHGSNMIGANFHSMVKQLSDAFNNMNFFLQRVKKYNPNGRNQTEEESNKISTDLIDMLIRYNIETTYISGDEKGSDLIFSKIMKTISKNS